MMLPDLRQNGMRYDGSLPIGWKIEPAQKACTKITDGTHATPTPVSTGRPFITAIHVKNGSINFEDCLYLTEADHREIFKRCNAQRGDLAIVNIGA
jgi:type I restriction enzyme, S subunit